MRVLLFLVVILVEVLLTVSRSRGADTAPPPVPAIRFPDIPVPAPPPPPVPDPSAVPALAADSLYVIDSDVDVMVEAFPAGLVTLTQEPGPLKVRGKFVGGSGKVETRTFKGKTVTTIDAVAGASGRVTIVVIPAGSKSPADWIRKVVDVGSGQAPRPPPGPGPVPNPGGKLFGVVVADRTNLDPKQAQALASASFRQYLVAGGHELDMIDTQTQDPNERSKLALFQPFIDRARFPAGSSALVLLDNSGATKGLVRSVVVLPATDADLVGAFKLVVGK
ncbi:MAG: hypothetical protein JWO38_4866 [Gemmataceae bacterium]|nr:hypothetical protein [Gemmataceae bacterium]